VKAAVVDASVAIKWVVDEQFSEQADALLAGTTLCAPAHWQAEATNGIWGYVRRGRMLAVDAKVRAAAMINAPVEPVPLAALLDRAFDLALTLRLPVYDTLYVALARTRAIPLVSDDQKLLQRMKGEPSLAALALPLADLP
jgi:predicted nucleic acid-binding protein